MIIRHNQEDKSFTWFPSKNNVKNGLNVTIFSGEVVYTLIVNEVSPGAFFEVRLKDSSRIDNLQEIYNNLYKEYLEAKSWVCVTHDGVYMGAINEQGISTYPNENDPNVFVGNRQQMATIRDLFLWKNPNFKLEIIPKM